MSVEAVLFNHNAKDSERFMVGDIVQFKNLKSKRQWNGRLATIAAPFVHQKKRWPVTQNFGNGDKILIKTENLQIIKSTKVSEDLSKQMDEMDLGPMNHRCPKCNAKLFKGEYESNGCYYCQTGTSQSDWEQGKNIHLAKQIRDAPPHVTAAYFYPPK